VATQEDTNLALVKKAYDMLGKNDIPGFFALFAADAELHEAPSLPYGGVYRGLAAVQRGSKLVFNAWKDFTYEVLQYTAGGDLVIVHVMICGVGKNTGKSFSMPIAELWRVKDGKVVELRPFYYDTHRAVEVYG